MTTLPLTTLNHVRPSAPSCFLLVGACAAVFAWALNWIGVWAARKDTLR
jgi:hypothetical protein